jgi:hypothetical protein
MRIIISALLGFSVVAGLAAPIGAQALERQGYHKQTSKKHYKRVAPRREGSTGRSDYYEQWADKLPVGSSRWFEQMEREGRFGGSNVP